MMHAERTVENTMQMAKCGADWMRRSAEESLKQTRAMMEGFIANARSTAESFDDQSARAAEVSTSLAREALQFLLQAMHEPKKFFELQSAFMSKQAELLAEQRQHVAESLTRRTNDVGRTMSEGSADQRWSKAA